MLGDVTGTPASPMAFSTGIPATVLWAWEEPEDLRTVDPAKVGVAYLARTLLLGDAFHPAILPRHQPLAVPPAMAVMAVVRIETRPGFRDTPALRLQTAAALANVSRRPGLRALQVDFDATRSERDFYSGVLRTLRPQMPSGMPLSITALVSWCSDEPGSNPQQNWLASLPIDEAVPMFFRLGGHTKPYDDKTWIPVRQPLCRSSLGLSTDESWPQIPTPARVYLFAPGPWQSTQLAALGDLSPTQRPAALRQPNRQGDVTSNVAALRAAGDLEPPVFDEEEQ
jgi:hypothetical protein